MKSKADKLLQEDRVRAVVSWVLKGYFTKDILKQINTNFGVEERMGYYYLKLARKEIRNIRSKELEDIIAFHHSARLMLYNNLEGKKTPSGAFAAMDILKDMARLDQLYVDRHKLEFDKVNLQVNLSMEEIKNISKALDESN